MGNNFEFPFKISKISIYLMKRYKRFILTGKAASGKDYAKNLLADLGFKCDISITTRPMREGEEEGVNYYYTSVDEFEKRIEKDE